MTPHKNKLVNMSDMEIQQATRIVDVKDHNVRHDHLKRIEKSQDADRTLSIVRKRHESANSTPRSPKDVESHIPRFDRVSPRITTTHPPNVGPEHYSESTQYPDERNFRRW